MSKVSVGVRVGEVVFKDKVAGWLIIHLIPLSDLQPGQLEVNSPSACAPAGGPGGQRSGPCSETEASWLQQRRRRKGEQNGNTRP